MNQAVSAFRTGDLGRNEEGDDEPATLGDPDRETVEGKNRAAVNEPLSEIRSRRR
jgi:hypothetical protein